MEGKAQVSSFRTRTSIFLILLMFLSSVGLGLMALTQDELYLASNRIREALLPSSRLVENAKREIDLQIQELTLLESFEPAGQNIDTAKLALLRVPPSVQSLLRLHNSSLFPGSLHSLFQPWSESVNNYSKTVSQFSSYREAIDSLYILREKTVLLHRAVERELSVQLLKLNESSQRYSLYWAGALLLGFFFALAFALYVWKWMRPLNNLKTWLLNGALVPPASVKGSGLSAPPAEVQELVEAMRKYVLEHRAQEEELNKKAKKMEDNEISLLTLFSGISHLLRHNDNLLKELIKKEKLASMSEMAAQLAHEIRNPLNSMNLKLELLKEKLPLEHQKSLDRVLDEIDRLDALTESHLSATRKNLSGLYPLKLHEDGKSQVHEVLSEIEQLNKEALSMKGISFKFQSNPQAQPLPLPRSVLKSTLINLIKNAEEALAQSSEKVIELRHSEHNSLWKIEILDSGCGFPENFQTQNIEAFRSHKHEGSGLGLYTAQKMLEAYQAHLIIEKQAPHPFKTLIRIEGPLLITETLADLNPLRENQSI